jgi:hypothetical protein
MTKASVHERAVSSSHVLSICIHMFCTAALDFVDFGGLPKIITKPLEERIQLPPMTHYGLEL